MKKLLKIVLVFLMGIYVYLPLTACTEKTPEPSEGLEYTLSEDGTYYEVSGIGTCTDTDIVVPATHEGIAVKKIAKEAFKEGNLTSVYLFEGIENIEYAAFYDCQNLLDITFPEGLSVIGDYAFGLCEKLKNIIIPDSVVEIEYGAFALCSGLETLKISKNAQLIGTSAFIGCTSLQDVKIPDSVTDFRDSVFAECISLKSVKIGDYVNSREGLLLLRSVGKNRVGQEHKSY